MAYVECRYCNNRYQTQQAVNDHMRAVHRAEPEICTFLPFPEAEGHGEWVYRAHFRGKKGFGVFECKHCNRLWMSAHAYKNKFRQDCQGCERPYQPYIMWRSDLGYVRENTNVSQAPHDSSRCEACLSGYPCVSVPRTYSQRSQSNSQRTSLPSTTTSRVSSLQSVTYRDSTPAPGVASSSTRTATYAAVLGTSTSENHLRPAAAIATTTRAAAVPTVNASRPSRPHPQSWSCTIL